MVRCSRLIITLALLVSACSGGQESSPGESTTSTPPVTTAPTSTSAPATTTQPGLVTFTVTTPGDTADTNPGDGDCRDETSQCSLRAAIEETNALAGSEVIVFDTTVFDPNRPATITVAPDDRPATTVPITRASHTRRS